jgi:hypothetical protein
MMRSSLVVLAIFGIVFAFGTARAEDYNPPTWRGEDNTTTSVWEFDVDGSYNLVAPDSFLANPGGIGAPTFSIEYDPPDTVWNETWDGADGVWRLESPSNITIVIPNYDLDNPIKEIWMQITYQSSGGGEPYIYTNPLYDSEPTTSDPQVNGNYLNLTYHIIIKPNPTEETIWIQPLDCTLYIDEIVIDTICVPEPTTICLLSLGGLLVLRKRRG